MRKSKPKLGNLLMIAMILIAIFYIYIDKKNIPITAEELVVAYQENKNEANNKFLYKNIELTGKVKSYYSFNNQPNLLELSTQNTEYKIFCSFLSTKYDSIAASLTYDTPIIIYGIFKEIKDENSHKEIYIEAEKINVAQK